MASTSVPALFSLTLRNLASGMSRPRLQFTTHAAPSVVVSRKAHTMSTPRFTLLAAPIVSAAIALSASPALAAPSVGINLAGVQFKNATNQSRDSSTSSPSTVDAATHYTFATSGLVKGDSGLLRTLYPNPTPLATVLETLAPGSSAGLSGSACNPSGTLPFTLGSQTTSGSTVLGFITVTYALTIDVGIRADGVTYFNLTNVVLNPAALVGSLSFTSGESRVTAVCTADFNADGFTDFTDFDTYITAFEAGSDAADMNCDGFIDFTDFDSFVTAFEAGC